MSFFLATMERGRIFSLLIGISFFQSLMVSAQEVTEENKKLAEDFVAVAEEIMANTQAMIQARDMYAQAADLDPTNVKANYMAGDFHLQTIGKDRAVKYFSRVLKTDPDYRFDILYWIGRSYHYGMDFENALAFYERYRKKLTTNDGYRGRDRTELPIVERRIFECKNAIEFVANPAHYSIVNIGTAINTEEEDYAPVLNEDETMMVFTSRRREDNLNENVFEDNKPYEDIFIAYKKGDRWEPAVNIGEPVSTLFHESSLALSADGVQLFFYKDDNNGDIFVSNIQQDGTWEYPEPLSDNINSQGFKESSISISPDGQVLFFASDRPGGYGGIDIYYSVKDRTGQWVRAKNLGPGINTEYNDDGPFIDYDGKTLYFSTQGRKGMGGYDIFKSEYDSAAGEWSEPTNLGYPINTPDDDIYFVSTKDGKRGYYASVREDGEGFTDIYMVTILQEGDVGETLASKDAEPLETKTPDNDNNNNIREVELQENNNTTPSLKPLLLTVNVVEQGSNRAMDAKVGLSGRGDNRVAGYRKVGRGKYEFRITSRDPKDYQLSVEKNGFIFQDMTLRGLAASTEERSIRRTVTMRKLKVGSSKVLRNIYFQFNKTGFLQSSYTELNKLENLLAQNSRVRVEIAGHTDSIGKRAYNLQLSQRRANAVKDYLIRKGIDPRRVNAVGYGETRPLASNDDEREGRELNRRVEFKVLSN